MNKAVLIAAALLLTVGMSLTLAVAVLKIKQSNDYVYLVMWIIAMAVLVAHSIKAFRIYKHVR